MRPAFFGWTAAFGVIVVLLASSVLFLGIPTHRAGVPQSALRVADRMPRTPAPVASAGALPVSGPRASAVRAAQAALGQEGGNLSRFFPPNLNAAPAPAAETGGHIVPLYAFAPAPIGLADYGLSNLTGSPAPYSESTTSLMGSFTTTDPRGLLSEEFDFGTQSAYGGQLNAVLTNVTLSGQTGFSGTPNDFWLQNVITYTPSLPSGQLVLEDNIWNFSSLTGYFPGNSILHGLGRVSASEFYSAAGGSVTVPYPFSLSLYLNSTVGVFGGTGPVNEVYFNFSVWGSTGALVRSGSYDNVYFSSERSGHPPVSPGSAELLASGYQYNPIGLPNDFEIDWGVGTSDGATTSVVYANATLGLYLLNSSTGHYQAPRASYDFGSDSGETATGAYVFWQKAASGFPIGRLVTGPSLLHGLWNASKTGPGSFSLGYAGVAPSNAWVGVAFGVAVTNQSNFQVDPTFGWYTGTGRLGKQSLLAPGIYTIEVMLSGYNPTQLTINLSSGSSPISVALVANASRGVYTPIWAFSTAQLAALSIAGTGTPASPYQLIAHEPGSMSTLFAGLNDFLFPVWLGVYLNGTTAHAEFAGGAPTLLMTYPTWQRATLNFFDVPVSDQFQIYLNHVQNFALDGAHSVSTWAANTAVPIFSVVLKACSNDLVASNFFNVSSEGLELTGGAVSGSQHNTIWGNTFYSDPQPSYSGVDLPTNGLTLSESGDLIYNNAFLTNTTAISGGGSTPPTPYSNVWNVSLEPSTNVRVVDGVPLSGSILGGSTQGGNFWTNYGSEADPFGTLPYANRLTSLTSRPEIAVGGDSAPLVPFTLYPITFSEHGLVAGSTWNVRLSGPAGQVWFGSSSGPTLRFFEPNGTYRYQALPATGNQVPANATGILSVSGTPALVTIAFGFGYRVTFAETGLAPGTSWAVTVAGTRLSLIVSGGSGSLPFPKEPNGSYAYSIAPIAGWQAPTFASSGSLVVRGASLTETVPYSPVVYPVNWSESGLPAGTNWSVRFAGTVKSLDTTASAGLLSFGSEPNGTYSYSISDVSGWHESNIPYIGTVTVSGAGILKSVTYTPESYSVSFVERGLAAGLNWSVQLDAMSRSTVTDGGTDSLTFLAANGSHPYQISNLPGWHQSSVPYSGSVLVAGTVLVNILYAQQGYSVQFEEAGLPTGLTWGGTFHGLNESMTSDGATDVLSFGAALNGSYGYSISDVAGWHENTENYSGALRVAGAGVTFVLAFVAVTYAVAFTESGLSNGLNWTVEFGGVTQSLRTDFGPDLLRFLPEPNGSYAYVVTSPPGHVPVSVTATGSELVAGGPINVLVTYLRTSYPVRFSESGLPAGVNWSISVNQSTVSVLSDGGNDSISFAAEPNGSFPYSISDISGWHQATIPYVGTLTVNGSGATEVLLYRQFTSAVVVTEHGLPAGLFWAATVNGLQSSLTTDGWNDSLGFPAEPNGSYVFTLADLPGWHENSVPYLASLSVSGFPVALNLSYSRVTYAVVFTESSLPAGVNWSATVNGRAESLTADGGTDSLSFPAEPNGTYLYRIADVAGWHEDSSAYVGNLSINGSGIGLHLAYTEVRSQVQLSETGLPSGVTWSVSLNGSVESVPADGGTDQLPAVMLPNGTYVLSVFDVSGWHQTSVPYSGTVLVDGTTVTIGLVYSQVTYNVTFTESGLPAGLTWSVSVDGANESLVTDGSADALHFAREPNGSASYQISDLSGWHETSLAYHSTIFLSGASLFSSVSYAAVMYAASFDEQGLASGTNWSVSIGGQTIFSTTPVIVFFLSNGTHPYSFGNARNYTRPSSGSVGVVGGAVTIMPSYVLVRYAVAFVETGLGTNMSWSVSAGGASATGPLARHTLNLGNGSYPWAVTPIPGYNMNWTGTAAVLGGPVTVSLIFHIFEFEVLFRETGLPSGDSWQVSMNGHTVSSFSTGIGIWAGNGTHSFVASAVGFTASPGSSSVSISGSKLIVPISMSRS